MSGYLRGSMYDTAKMITHRTPDVNELTVFTISGNWADSSPVCKAPRYRTMEYEFESDYITHGFLLILWSILILITCSREVLVRTKVLQCDLTWGEEKEGNALRFLSSLILFPFNSTYIENVNGNPSKDKRMKLEKTFVNRHSINHIPMYANTVFKNITPLYWK